jgi:Laminin G domain
MRGGLGRALGRTARGRPTGGVVLAAFVTTVCAVVFASGGPAQASTVVALWNMNEAPGSTVLVDSGPNQLNGTIGTSITLNGSVHSFPAVTRGVGGTVDPQHLDVVNSPLLNPGTSDFIVTVRLLIPSLAASFGNVMQKGQTGSPTGFWKIELDGGTGRVFCGFRSIVNGVTTNGGIRSPIIVADNQWHTVTCERGPGFVSTTVDGHVTKQLHSVGSIVNNVALTIGGKANCNATLTHLCDYFVGQIDFVQITTG